MKAIAWFSAGIFFWWTIWKIAVPEKKMQQGLTEKARPPERSGGLSYFEGRFFTVGCSRSQHPAFELEPRR